MSDINQTFVSFRDKWTKNRDLAFAETLREGSDINTWILKRNGLNSTAGLQSLLHGRRRVLDAGCGNGRVTALLRCNVEVTTEIVGIDLTAADVARENLSDLPNVSIYQKDLLEDLSGLGDFDLIYCQEVLHHTANPKGGFLNLCKSLAPAGEIAIYVYKIKAPLREFADDYVRGQISNLPYDEAMRLMKQVTELGKVLTDLNIKVNVPEVEVLKIPAGEYEVQRLFYHFFLKCFWNEAMSEHDNVVINYDWYHPQLCTRHTMSEIKQWFADAGLAVRQECEDFYGITVRGQRVT